MVLVIRLKLSLSHNNKQGSFRMQSFLFEDDSLNKANCAAIGEGTLKSFFEFYAGYLLDSKNVSDKKSCFESVGKLVSEAMDRGECSAATMEHMKRFISNYQMTTVHAQRKQQRAELFEAICYQLATNQPQQLESSLLTKLTEYKTLCDRKRVLEQELSGSLNKPVVEVLTGFISGHKSSLGADFDFIS